MKLFIFSEPKCLERTIHQKRTVEVFKMKNISGNENLESPDMMLGHGDVKNANIRIKHHKNRTQKLKVNHESQNKVKVI